ncbi:hypothetical protein M436DRAFT_60853 [Aureobasidium namibiae CBS 147.97]|uniref:Uncharacterized protein n=1 Tax=Aureobasidium namibiae CBS 147.97 TaxID=1043004 RepID=A0A074WV74_9PEZI|nr:uncharacterized protein M436DRAFT_60853 [Aureobasidium namibiae CBS 147.97]KEQ77073.1 hypothetical protein M436DRAFT_60853 [Aureobasidium namibiae CBS 147.97]
MWFPAGSEPIRHNTPVAGFDLGHLDAETSSLRLLPSTSREDQRLYVASMSRIDGMSLHPAHRSPTQSVCVTLAFWHLKYNKPSMDTSGDKYDTTRAGTVTAIINRHEHFKYSCSASSMFPRGTIAASSGNEACKANHEGEVTSVHKNKQVRQARRISLPLSWLCRGIQRVHVSRWKPCCVVIMHSTHKLMPEVRMSARGLGELVPDDLGDLEQSKSGLASPTHPDLWTLREKAS